jgi:hypothetical protein
MIARTLLIASALTLGALALPAQADGGVSVKFVVTAPPHVKVVHASHHGHGYGHGGHPGRIDHHWQHERRYEAAHHRHHDHWQNAQRHSGYQHRHEGRDRDDHR